MEKEEIQNNETTIPEVQSEPKEVPQSTARIPEAPNQKPWLIIGLTVLVLLLLGTTGFFAYKNQQIAQQLTEMKTSQEKTQTTPTPTPLKLVTSKQTYINEEHQFSFDYPQNLKPFELSNGVVTFLPEEAYDSCKAAQGSKDINAFEPCYKATFNFNGYQVNPPESYEEHIQDIKDFAKLSSFTDDKNRTWDTSLVLGQVYNFDAFTQIDGTPIRVSFQYGFDAPSEQDILSFFNEILSTFKLLQ